MGTRILYMKETLWPGVEYKFLGMCLEFQTGF